MLFRQDLFCEIPMQPDILGSDNSFSDIHLNAEEIIETLYEPLRLVHPEMIHREFMGMDTTGVHPMWMYEFVPNDVHATVYLQSGVHPIETEGIFGLARIMQLWTDGSLPALSHVRFLVVPVVSVYGAHGRAQAERIAMNYDIKHNALGINANRDCDDQQLAETRNVLEFIRKHQKEIDFAFDLHTTTNTDWGDYMTVYPDGLPTRELLVETNAFLRERNIRGRIPYVRYVGPESLYPNNGVPGTMHDTFACCIFKRFGIPCCTLEHSDFSFDSQLGSSIAITRAVEQYVNHIIQALHFYGKV